MKPNGSDPKPKRAQLREKKPKRTAPLDGALGPGQGKGPRPFLKQIDYTQPEQVEYVALQLIKHRMSYRLAFRELFPELSLGSLKEQITQAKNSPQLKKELGNQFESVGLGGEAKAAFLNELYTWFYGDDKGLAITAAKLLGRGFIGEKIHLEKPETLKFEGLEKGVERMELFGGDAEPDQEEADDDGPAPAPIQ